MNLSAAVVTTFPNNSFDVYAKSMLQNFVSGWPQEIPLMVSLDDDLLLESVQKLIRPQDGIAIGWADEHQKFVENNKDDPQNYRLQPVRFCHKIFSICRAYDATLKQKKAGENAARYLIWMDADVIINRSVSLNEIMECLPKPGDAVSTLQRKDWPHSECGWMAFDLENRGGEIIVELFKAYTTGRILQQKEHHDSWMFDIIVKELGVNVTNLTPNVPGLDVWQSSPMGKWSRHYKGPVAKQELMGMKDNVVRRNNSNIHIQTQNAIPHEEIQKHIEENQSLITNWVKPCIKHNEEIVMVSAGPMLIAEDLRKEIQAGRNIVAVKHAVEPLKKAGITPWACILLDPRPHVNDFVKDPDPNILWFVASQVEPSVVRKLLDSGCTVWGYHASVNAGEQDLINKQPYSIISGGSATATRGLFLMSHIGFNKFRLYGYDLCHPDKPDMNAKDEFGQQKNMEISIQFCDRNMNLKRHFWTEAQFIAQYQEMEELIKSDRFEMKAFGDGVIPFLVRCKNTSDLRNKEITAKMLGGKTQYYKDLLGWKSKTNWRKWLPKTPRKLLKANNY